MPTRKEIAEIALDLFLREGYEGVSIKNITDALEITKGSLYYHYTGKEDLFLRTVDLFLQQIYARYEDLIPDEVDSAEALQRHLVELFAKTVDFLNEKDYDAGFLHMIIQGKRATPLVLKTLESRYRKVHERITVIFKKEYDAGRIRPFFDPEQEAGELVILFEGYMMLWIKTGSLSLKETFKKALDYKFSTLLNT
ncbi:MAG TPA: TetR/AcrR family transcriptional regulator [Candidatus Mcinerneyibacteriales bacterium]|nr:TetR/AcrR family transcriptional regulator [Candidatus Mcinerneyibacteriales bacterium]HPE20061.1 TetR/AcrR family transcriptional regulator [Candidatus Mcinerneyibacteriales bacterium]HPJ69332.1 TetR/AcrR family transcriptional regulator [Candidatus Mcinerneyibacteriales bacterium]HPQ89369.1 TetR/AcrR family transcriptional regulator [Candidatus Mcinerneyibacteriales bacterium]